MQLVWKGKLKIYGQSKKATFIFSFRKDTVIDGPDAGAKNYLLRYNMFYGLFLNNWEKLATAQNRRADIHGIRGTAETSHCCF